MSGCEFKPDSAQPLSIGPIRDWVRDGSGQLILVDELNHRLLVDTGNGLQAHGRRGSRAGEFRHPAGIALLDGRAYVVDSSNHRIQVFRFPVWDFDFEFGGFGSEPGQLFCPSGITCVETSKHGTVLCVVDSSNNRLSVHLPGGQCVSVYNLAGRRFPVAIVCAEPARVEIKYEDGLAESIDVNLLVSPRRAVVADWLALQERNDLTYEQKHQANSQVLDRLNRAEREATQLAASPRSAVISWPAAFVKPISLVSDSAGFIYVADFGLRNVRKFDREGNYVADVLAEGKLPSPGKMAIAGNKLFVTDAASRRIAICHLQTGEIQYWDCPIEWPGVIASDGERLWIASYDPGIDARYRSIQVFDQGLQQVTAFDVEGLLRPTSIAVAKDRVFVGDETICGILVLDSVGQVISRLGRDIFCAPVWAVRLDAFGDLWAGSGRKLYHFNSNLDLDAEFYVDGAWATGAVVDISFSESVSPASRIHFIDFDRAAVRWMDRPSYREKL